MSEKKKDELNAIASATECTGAVAAAAVKRGLCARNRDILVKLPGGDLTVRCQQDRIILTGEVTFVFEGAFAY